MPPVSVRRHNGYISGNCGEKLKIVKFHWHSLAKGYTVNFTAVQGIKPQTGNKVIAILFLQPRCYVGLGGQRHAPAALPPGKKLGTDCTGFRVGHTEGLDRCEKTRPYRDSIPYRPAIRGYATPAHNININFNKDVSVSSHLIQENKNAHIWINRLLCHKIG